MKTNEEIELEAKVVINQLSEDGGSGIIYSSAYPKLSGTVIWSTGGGWNHVSISPYNKRHIPTWEEMCWLKNIFFHEDEAAIQIHPKKNDYVNEMPNCLHLWECTYIDQPLPPSFMVGRRPGQSIASVAQEVREWEDFLNGKR